MGGEFPALPAPRAGDAVPIQVEQFLLELHGPPGTGIHAGAALSDFERPRSVAVDVRSPSEFALGHIPGAVNVPLFTDEGRAAVGTTYARKGRQAAIRLGLEAIGPRLAELVREAEEAGATPDQPVLLYCWRGGMRSGSVGWLLTLCGFKVHLLQGGYRSYRRWCKSIVGNKEARAPAPIVVLGGCTGVGKTAVLHELRQRGEQILDLEGLANHRGSAFGSIGMATQPSNEAFENVVALAIRRADVSRRVWIEHEGQHVGKVLVPFGVADWVQRAPRGAMIIMEMAKELRVQRLVEDYTGSEGAIDKERLEALRTCVSKGLAKKLGGQRVKEALEWLDQGKFGDVAGMMLSYYDKLYRVWESQSLATRMVHVDCTTAAAAENAKLVLEAIEKLPTESDAADASSTARRALYHRAGLLASSASGILIALAALGTSNANDRRIKGPLLTIVGLVACGLAWQQRSLTPEPKECQGAFEPTASRGSPSPCSQASTTASTPSAASRAEVEGDMAEWSFHGQCYCGEVRIMCKGEPRSVSFCHCSICRRLSGAPCTSQALFPAEQVAISLEPGASLQMLQTSRAVERHRCGSCFAPVQGVVLGGKLKAVPLALLSPSGGATAEFAEALRPKVHLHYADRVVDIRDGLPKYRAGAHAGAMFPESEW